MFSFTMQPRMQSTVYAASASIGSPVNTARRVWEVDPLNTDDDLVLRSSEATANPSEPASVRRLIADIFIRNRNKGHRAAVGLAKRAPIWKSCGEVMNLLQSFQQAIRRLVFQRGSCPIDIAAAQQPLDPLTDKIRLILLMAIRDGATEIRFVPNKRNLQVFAVVKGSLEELLPLPFLKKTARPIARILKQTLQGCPPQRDREAATEGTIHVGGHPVHLSLFSTPTDHGDLLTIRIVDPGVVGASTELGGIVDGDECVFYLEGVDDDSTPPPSPEESRRSFREMMSGDPTIFHISDG